MSILPGRRTYIFQSAVPQKHTPSLRAHFLRARARKRQARRFQPDFICRSWCCLAYRDVVGMDIDAIFSALAAEAIGHHARAALRGSKNMGTLRQKKTEQEPGFLFLESSTQFSMNAYECFCFSGGMVFCGALGNPSLRID